LVLHGWGGKSDSWIAVSEILAESGYQVIAPDLPGFGKSGDPNVPWITDDYLKFAEDFVAELKLDKFCLVGHSFGGGLAAMYASEHSDKVKRLILCDAAIIRAQRLNWRQKFVQQCAVTLVHVKPWAKSYGLMAPSMVKVCSRFFYRFAGVRDYQDASPIMKQTFKNIIKDDLRRFARRISVPTLIVWGKEDKSTPVDDAYALNKIIDSSKLEIINGCGHNPHRTHASRLSLIISGFFK